MQRLDLDVERAKMPVALLVLDARVGELDVPILLGQVVLDGPAMDLLRRSIGSPIAVRLAAIAFLQKLLVFAFQLVIQDDAADGRAAFAQPFRVLEVGAIDLRIVHQLAWPVDGEARMTDASDSNVELLLRSRLPTAPIVRDATTFAVDRLPPQFIGVHSRPAVAIEDVSASLGQHHQRPVITAGRNRVDQPGVLEVPQIAPVRVERTVVTIAEIAGRDDAEGTDGRHRADLGAAQRDVAVARPDTLAFTAARQFEVTRKHVTWIEPFASPRIRQPAAAALVQLATVDIAIARVINRSRIEIHSRTTLPM